MQEYHFISIVPCTKHFSSRVSSSRGCHVFCASSCDHQRRQGNCTVDQGTGKGNSGCMKHIEFSSWGKGKEKKCRLGAMSGSQETKMSSKGIRNPITFDFPMQIPRRVSRRMSVIAVRRGEICSCQKSSRLKSDAAARTGTHPQCTPYQFFSLRPIAPM